MNLDAEFRSEFSKKVRTGVLELIDLNQIESLDEFDAGLFISNVFERKLKTNLDLKSMEESEVTSLRTFLWSAVYNNLEIERYETYIKDNLKD